MITKQQTSSEQHLLDVTVFQSSKYGVRTNYRQVFRDHILCNSSRDALDKIYRLLNVKDTLPPSYSGRYMNLGDIVFIDRGVLGHEYFQLQHEGFAPVPRLRLLRMTRA